MSQYDFFTECPNMKFGDNCTNTCTCKQDNTLTCNHVNGVCNCMPGYTGDQCQNGKVL